MKKVLFIITLVAVAQFSWAQILPLVSKDSTATTSVYAGVINGFSFRVEKPFQESFYSFRVGAIVSWQALPFLKIKSFGTFDYSGGNSLPLNSFSVKLHNKKEKFSVEFGRMATLSTELRPLPPTANGHFETWSQARIPGGALGIKTTYRFNSGASFGLGIAERGDKAEYHAKFSFKKIELASYYSVCDEKIGVATVFSVGRLYNVISFENIGGSSIIANFSNFDIAKGIGLYLDAGYETETSNFPRMEIGFSKAFEVGKIGGGLFALGYKHESKAVNLCLFVHL
ncbi:MAG: hypothetical protein WC928_00635 [Patescibacteria group bacterium]|jgi:hypothetical protein